MGLSRNPVGTGSSILSRVSQVGLLPFVLSVQLREGIPSDTPVAGRNRGADHESYSPLYRGFEIGFEIRKASQLGAHEYPSLSRAEYNSAINSDTAD
jgi:hypothetical protein